MAVVFTDPRFYRGCSDYLYLFQHCATKTMCEAVVEGMGSVWAKCAEPERHAKFETHTQEAVVSWSAPQPWHPAAKTFINTALNHYFQGNQWNLSHTDSRAQRLKAWIGGSEVLEKLQKSYPSRLPAALYSNAA